MQAVWGCLLHIWTLGLLLVSVVDGLMAVLLIWSGPRDLLLVSFLCPSVPFSTSSIAPEDSALVYFTLCIGDSWIVSLAFHLAALRGLRVYVDGFYA